MMWPVPLSSLKQGRNAHNLSGMCKERNGFAMICWSGTDLFGTERINFWNGTVRNGTDSSLERNGSIWHGTFVFCRMERIRTERIQSHTNVKPTYYTERIQSDRKFFWGTLVFLERNGTDLFGTDYSWNGTDVLERITFWNGTERNGSSLT